MCLKAAMVTRPSCSGDETSISSYLSFSLEFREAVVCLAMTAPSSASSSYPVSISQLHFPSGVQNLSHVLSDLRRSALSITNRLKSIEGDSQFVQDIAEHFDLALPLVANERCGSWYIPLEKKGGSAYFKSTDGHAGRWDFSLRRLNLQIFDIVNQHGG